VSRKPLQHRLPPLASVAPEGVGPWPAGANVQHEVTTRLRAIAQRCCGDEPQPFYPLRETADFFGAPRTTIVRAYQTLETEGWLVRLRGSMTLLRGRKSQPREPVRGVVVVPVWEYGFCWLPDWRHFFRHLKDELRAHQYVVDFEFYRGAEAKDPSFAERLLAHHPAAALWLFPTPPIRQLLRQLRDGGLPALVVTYPEHGQFPCRQYVIHRVRALAQGLKAWREDGIREVIAPRFPGQETLQQWVADVAARVGVPLRWVVADDLTPLRAADRTGYLLADDICLSYVGRQPHFSWDDWMAWHRTLALQRLLAPRSPVGNQRLDVVWTDWSKLARAVTADIVSEQLHHAPETVTVMARWRPQIPLADFSDDL